MQPLLGYNYGTQNLSRIRAALRKLTFLTIVVGCSLALVCCLYVKTIVSLFLKEPEALAIGQKMVEILVLTGAFFRYLLYCFQFSSSNWTCQIRISGFASSSGDFSCSSFGYHGSFYGANGKYLGCYPL